MRRFPIDKLLIPCVLSAFLFPQNSIAQEAVNDTPAPVNPGIRSKIGCHGIANVPMTADPEQTLPLRIVANLKCGEEVAVLSDSEGYTSMVRAADGSTGYVAAMYIKKLPLPRRAPELISANLKNGVARWHDGAPGCDQFMSDGTLVESITANGITVQVSLHDTGWKFRANVAIANGGTQTINVNPAKFILDSVGPHGKPLFYQNPEELAKNVTHQVLWTEANAAPATMQARSESNSNSAPVNLSYRTPLNNRAAAPNYLVQHQAAHDEAIRNQGKQTLVNTAQQIQRLALKAGAVSPNDKLTGAVWFDREKNPQQLILRIPIDDYSFEFPLSFKQ